MAVTVQAASIANWAGTLASTSPFGHNLPVTVGAGTNRVLLVSLGNESDVSSGWTVTFNGVALTRFDSQSVAITSATQSIWYLLDPPVGTFNLFVGVGSWYAATAAVSAAVFDGVDQTTPLITGVNYQYPYVSLSITRTLATAAGADDAVFSGITLYASGTGLIVESGAVAVGGLSVVNARSCLSSYKIGAATTVSYSWTLAGDTQLGVVAAVVKASSAAGTDATADGVTLTGMATLTPGTATGGSGAVDATAEGVTLTGSATLTPGTATGGVSGSFVSSPMYSSGILQASVALDWTWYPGAIGATPTASLVHGSGATAGDGRLTAAGLSAGSGFILAKTADGAIYYEAGTVV